MYRNRKYRGRLSVVTESLASSSQSTAKTTDNTTAVVEGDAPPKNNITAITVTSDGSFASAGSTSDKENAPSVSSSAKPTSRSQYPQPTQHRQLVIEANIHRPTPSTSHNVGAQDDDDLFVIPASQITTQSRFISQRSMLCRTQHSQLGGTIATGRIHRNYFEKVLHQCGVRFDCAEAYVLEIDHISLVGQLRRHLCDDPTYPVNVREFLKGLHEEGRTASAMIKLMSGCKVQLPDCDASTLTQDSLVQDFLMLDVLKNEVRLMLFAKLKQYAGEEDGGSLTLIRLLLIQLTLVDQRQHGEAVLEQIFDILAVSSDPARLLIINRLEDIVDITLHNRVMTKLFELFPDDNDLLSVATVTTFGNLSLNVVNRNAIRKRIVQHMCHAYTADPANVHQNYPDFVQFMLQLDANETDAMPHVIRDLRSCLRWPPTTAANCADVNASQRAVFECIVRGLIQSRKLFDTWLRLVAVQLAAGATTTTTTDGDADGEAETETEQLDDVAKKEQENLVASARSLDVLVLLAMQSINDDKRNYIENIIRRQIKAGNLRAEHIEHIVVNYADVLQQFAKVLLEMLNGFFSDRDATLARLAADAYRFLFGIETWDRNLIVARLVAGVCHDVRRAGSNVCDDGTRTAALLTLTAINAAHPEQMQLSGNQLLRVLDYTDAMSLSQVRLFMDLLCGVAYATTAGGQGVAWTGAMVDSCASDGVPVLREHLDMLVKKQVASLNESIRKQGIVSMVRLIDHMIWQPAAANVTPANVNDADATFDTIDDMSDGVAQDAARYVEYIRSICRRCASSLALCYDELAAIVSARHNRHHQTANVRSTGSHTANAQFIGWLCDLITDDFQEHFVAVELPVQPTSPHRIALEYRYCINAPEDNASVNSEVERIAINIGGGVLAVRKRTTAAAAATATTSAISSIVVLNSLFHLMRSLHSHRNAGNLEPIDAVLGCAIIGPCDWQPAFAQSQLDEIAESSGSRSGKLGMQTSQAQLMDMLVYTINWMRETVSAFVSQDNRMIRQKVLRRITTLVELERTARKQLAKLSTAYQMPTSQFAIRSAKDADALACKFKRPAEPMVATKKVAKPAKKTKKTGAADPDEEPNDATVGANTMAGDVTMLTALQPNDTSKVDDADKKVDNGDGDRIDRRTVYGVREMYRPLDLDIMLLLREDLQIDGSENDRRTDGSAFGMVEYEFILADLVNKIEAILGTSTNTAKSADRMSAHWQAVCSPADLINDLLHFVPRLVNAFKLLAAHMADILAGCVDDPKPKYESNANYAKACMSHTLRLLASVFRWPDFVRKENAQMLDKALNALLAIERADADVNEQMDAAAGVTLVVRAVRAVVGHEAVIIDLESAVWMVRLVQALAKFDGEQNNHRFVVTTCKQFLSRRWFAADGTAERGARGNVLLDELVAGMFVRIKLTSLQQLIAKVLAEMKRWKSKDSVLAMFPMIKRANFPILYRTMCAALIDALTCRIAKITTSTAHLKLWEDACQVCNTLLSCIESIDIPRNFVLFLKYGHKFVRTFLQHGLPMLEQCFRTNAERVREIIRSLQATTRYLHRLCCHSKSIQNAAVVAHIPMLRETVELLLVRVKALLVANKCCTTDVWEIGNLKNKDLHGQVLIQDEEFDDVDSIIPERMDEDDDDLDITESDSSKNASRVTKKRRKLRKLNESDDENDDENDENGSDNNDDDVNDDEDNENEGSGSTRSSRSRVF